MWKCKHCNIKFDFEKISHKANHARWCDKNPKKEFYIRQNINKAKKSAIQKFGPFLYFNVTCNSCGDKFKIQKRKLLFEPDKKYYCSRSCSSSVGGKRKQEKYGFDGKNSYRDKCFKYHDKACVVCKFNLVVDVHHVDGNRKNNIPQNLVPLCPNHHRMIHKKKYSFKIHEKINEYLIEKGFKESKSCICYQAN